jgi:hypothetical protein
VNCPRPDEFDLYLENELDESSARDFEDHLAGCASCRAALGDRKAFLEALHGLPDIELPPDFTDTVMARVFPEKKSGLAWAAALVGSISGLFLGGLAYVLATGRILPGFTIGAGKSLAESGRGGILTLAKVGKMALLALRLMTEFAGDLVEKLGRVGSHIDPKVYAAGCVLLLALSALFYLGIKRRILNGEKP